MNQRGKPKVYWLAYKPTGNSAGISTKPQPTHTGFGENKPSGSSEVTEIYSRQTLSSINDGGENKSSGANQTDNDIPSPLAGSAPGKAREEDMTLVEQGSAKTTTRTVQCIHDYVGGRGCYLCDPNHPARGGGAA
jgi:hypothetical protein